MDIVEQVKKTAVSSFHNILRASADHNGRFRMVMTTRTGGAEKPLLIVGNAHGIVEDGHCIAVLNPDKEPPPLRPALFLRWRDWNQSGPMHIYASRPD